MNDLKSQHIATEVTGIDNKTKKNTSDILALENIFKITGNKLSTWKSTGIFNYSNDSNMNAVGDFGGDLPDIKNDGTMCVYLSGNHFQQNKVIIPNNDNVINIYCVYEI